MPPLLNLNPVQKHANWNHSPFKGYLMEIKDEIVDNITFIHLKGKLDSSAAREFYAEMITLIDARNKQYLFEMSGVELVDSHLTSDIHAVNAPQQRSSDSAQRVANTLGCATKPFGNALN